MGSRGCPYPVPGDAWFGKKKRQNPDLDSQTSPGALESDPPWSWGQESAFHTALQAEPHKAFQGAECEHHPGVGVEGGDSCRSSSLPSCVKYWKSDSWARSPAHRGRLDLVSLAGVLC